MNTLNRYTAEYLSYCEYRKRLNFKTLKAYRIDLNQYSVFCNSSMSQVQICVYIHLPAMLVRLCCLYLQEI